MPTLAKLLPIRTSLPPLRALPYLLTAAISFHLAYQFPPLYSLMLLFLPRSPLQAIFLDTI